MKLIINTVVAFIITALLTKVSIPLLKRLKFGQNIREDGPQAHLKKSGTPTMGGIIFVPVAIIVSLVGGVSKEVFGILFLVTGFFIVGFIDDYLKVVKKENEGFKVLQKLIAQIVICIVFMYMVSDGATTIKAPFINGFVDLGYLYYPFLLVVILGTVNGVNITDGLDGLSTSVTIFVLAFFVAIGSKADADIALISTTFIGALLGFLIFNKAPAMLFMGDTGSLALGGLVSGLAIYLRIPLAIIFVGFIYFINALSVIIQVVYFKKTGKRFFKMAPLHHHFELLGYSENTIVIAFTIVTIVFTSIAYISLRL